MERSADWIAQARADVAHARNDLAAAFYDWACFSSQQAAEKAVKAVLMRLGAEPWGHAVADLLAEVAATVPVGHELLDAALELDKTYIAARYTDAHPSGAPTNRYTQREAERMVGYGEAIVRFCESHLSTARP
jgi:HEPN domain-containing protein